MISNDAINKAITILNDGGVIAYPTEAVYGLGCDPFNEKAVQRILDIKGRSVDKGLIVIAASWEQVQNLVRSVNDDRLKEIMASWPGPVTWVFPASIEAPAWITGRHDSIAIRITNHPIAQKLCEKFEGPIVSTSANITGEEAIRDHHALENALADKVDYIVPGALGDLTKPTAIRDSVTGNIIRP